MPKGDSTNLRKHSYVNQLVCSSIKLIFASLIIVHFIYIYSLTENKQVICSVPGPYLKRSITESHRY